MPRTSALQQGKPLQLEKAHTQQEAPSTAQINSCCFFFLKRERKRNRETKPSQTQKQDKHLCGPEITLMQSAIWTGSCQGQSEVQGLFKVRGSRHSLQVAT